MPQQVGRYLPQVSAFLYAKLIAYYPDKVIVRQELLGRTIRVHAFDSIIEHRTDVHKTYDAKEYLLHYASPSEKTFIYASAGIWETDQAFCAIRMSSESSDRMGYGIEGRIYPLQDKQYVPDGDFDDDSSSSRKLKYSGVGL